MVGHAEFFNLGMTTGQGEFIPDKTSLKATDLVLHPDSYTAVG